MKLLILTLPVTIVVFIMFFNGALKVHKNRPLWGVLGMLSFWIPVLVLGPIALNIVRETGDDNTGPALLLSYGAIVIAVGVFVAIMVYKKILVKPALLTVDNNSFVFCSECGTRCQANTAFCAKCGCKINGG